MGVPRQRQRVLQLGAGVLMVGTVLLAVLLLTRRHEVQAKDRETGEPPLVDISVKTVRPHPDKNFEMTVERPADVEAYYRANIEARVPGEVRTIRVAPGSHVHKDQQLVQLYVPDLWAAEREKGNTVRQRERELRLAEEKTSAARIAVKTAQANVEEKKTLLDKAKAESRYRNYVFDRFDQLWKKNAVDQNVRDEAEQNLAVARAAEAAALAARARADSEVEDAEANVKVMQAEVERMKQVVEVAKSEHEKAQALVEYAYIKAPFEGTVVSRKVDPGSFVQNASTGHPTPLLTLERTDIMTIAMRVPDNYAPFITPGTEATVLLDALPGVVIHGRVTRFSSSLENDAHDRTMRVEVDLWNGTPEEYRKFIADAKNVSELKEGLMPLVPEVTGSDPLHRSTHLLAGMYGKMTLVLKTFGNINLIPSQAILHEGGRSLIYVVEDGKAHRVPVEVQVDDGNLAKVVRLNEHNQPVGDLTGKEEVIVSNQEELTEGQPVKTTPADEPAGSHTKHAAN